MVAAAARVFEELAVSPRRAGPSTAIGIATSSGPSHLLGFISLPFDCVVLRWLTFGETNRFRILYRILKMLTEMLQSGREVPG